MAQPGSAQAIRISDTATLDVGTLSVEKRITLVVENAATRLPADVGSQLLTLIEPESLAVVATVLTVWAGAQFFGVGEIADVLLLITGWAILGLSALEAARLLYECSALVIRPKDQTDLEQAGELLARVVALIGVQATLGFFMRKPVDALKTQFFATSSNPAPFAWQSFKHLPTNRWWGYEPKTAGVHDPRLSAGEGGTDVYTGDIEYSLKGTDVDRRMALAHEQVHQFLTPKLRVLRRLRTFMRAQGYNRSYVLRYLEEALAETRAQLSVKGFTKVNFIEGMRFPIGPDYDVTIGTMKTEAMQILLGPIMVGGMTYQVWAVRRDPQQNATR